MGHGVRPGTAECLADDSYQLYIMDSIVKTLLVGSGGFVGANIRYWLGGFIQSRLGSTFPWQTMIINVTGSIVIGFFLGLMAGMDWHPNWRLFLAIGVLGGYTTYSSFAYEAIVLLGQKEYGRALFYIEGTALFTVFGAWLGLVLSRVVQGGKV
jgi:CrcB protein